MSESEENGLPRAEALIAEIYRQILQKRENCEKPEKVLIHAQLWEIINQYRQNLGTLSGPLPDYLAENEIFGLEVWYQEERKIKVT